MSSGREGVRYLWKCQHYLLYTIGVFIGFPCNYQAHWRQNQAKDQVPS